MARDPVCGMFVDEKKAKFKSSHEGKEYFFCSFGCKNNFDKNPDRYLKGTLAGCCRD
ncbi:MAG: YHS domain-containing protein [Candidatus Hadarchaeum sp.]|uniref:YHS domain-containing protein n=1 Tax=Candidatus Hadarchaeum sp. TaxID=2883567 RepID=UPI0031714FB3